MWAPLFNEEKDYFFDRMVRYMNKLDGVRNNNGVYRSILTEAWVVACDAYQQGHPKAWFYMMNLDAHAKNAKINLHKYEQPVEPHAQLKLDF